MSASTCPRCQGSLFYGHSVALDRYKMTSTGPKHQGTDADGDVERVTCVSCGAEFDVDEFFKGNDRRVYTDK